MAAFWGETSRKNVFGNNGQLTVANAFRSKYLHPDKPIIKIIRKFSADVYTQKKKKKLKNGT